MAAEVGHPLAGQKVNKNFIERLKNKYKNKKIKVH